MFLTNTTLKYKWELVKNVALWNTYNSIADSFIEKITLAISLKLKLILTYHCKVMTVANEMKSNIHNYLCYHGNQNKQTPSSLLDTLIRLSFKYWNIYVRSYFTPCYHDVGPNVMKAVKVINLLHENFQFFQDFFNKNEIQIFIDISWIHHEKCNQMSTKVVIILLNFDPLKTLMKNLFFRICQVFRGLRWSNVMMLMVRYSYGNVCFKML